MAFNLKACTIKANAIPWSQIQNSDFPTLKVGIAGIHAIEHLGPVLRFQATAARMNRNNCISRIIRPTKPRFHFEIIESLFQLSKIAFQFLGKF